MRKRVLCDENLPHKLRTLVPEHDLFTVAYMGWIGVKNGDLLSAAERERFDVLITSDQGFRHQQNMSGRKLAVVLLASPNWKSVTEQSRFIASAIDAAAPGTVARVPVCQASG